MSTYVWNYLSFQGKKKITKWCQYFPLFPKYFHVWLSRRQADECISFSVYLWCRLHYLKLTKIWQCCKNKWLQKEPGRFWKQFYTVYSRLLGSSARNYFLKAVTTKKLKLYGLNFHSINTAFQSSEFLCIFSHAWFCNMHKPFGKCWSTELCSSSKCWNVLLYIIK